MKYGHNLLSNQRYSDLKYDTNVINLMYRVCRLSCINNTQFTNNNHNKIYLTILLLRNNCTI